MTGDHDGPERSWMARLVGEMGRAAQAGNAQAARLAGLLAIAALAAALVIVSSR